MTQQDKKSAVRKPKLKLPFTEKKSDMGEWAYDHKVGLLSMVIAYLLFGIVFVSAKIFVGSEPHSQGFYVELEDLKALEELRDKLEEQTQQREEFDWESVQNRRSNDNSLDERVVDDRNTNTSALNDEAQRAQEEMEANRKAYEEALTQIDQQRKDKAAENKQHEERRDIKQKGNVTVSYSWADPVRHAQDLIVPAYQCEGGGEVVVTAELDRRGRVVSAEIKRGGDRCMQQTALRAAKASRFNVASSAPESHIGTITYIFIPQ